MQNIIRIMDFAAPELDVYARLSERQLLNLEGTAGGLFIAESPRVISRALDAGYVPVSALMAEEASDPQTRELLARLGPVPVYTAPFHVLKQLTGFPLTRGMLCAMERTALASVEEICKNARRVAVLEHVMNPTNVGAIFRSAAALSMDAVLLTPDCSDPLYRRAVRVSMGTVFQIPWTYLSRSPSWEEKGVHLLKDLGFRTAAMALRSETVSIDEPRLMAEEKLAVILGAEGDGLTDATIEGSDYTICIPMAHGVDSLNVAAASAVAFWQLGRNYHA